MPITLKVSQGSFVGDGATNQAINLGYQPKVLIQQRNGSEMMWMKIVGMTGSIAKSGDFTFDSNKLQFDTAGFTTWLNTNSQTYYWLALSWDNDNAIADIVGWTGDGVDNRDITTTVTNPELVFVTRLQGGVSPLLRTSDFSGDSSQLAGNFTGNKLITDGIQAFGTNSFQVGQSDSANANGASYVAFVLGASELLSVFSYVGNGSDNRNLNTLGIDPDYAYVHRTQGGIFDTNSPLHKYEPMTGDTTLLWPSTGGTGSNQIQAFITGGIQVGSSGEVNANGETIYGFAFVNGELSSGGGGGGGGGGNPGRGGGGNGGGSGVGGGVGGGKENNKGKNSGGSGSIDKVQLVGSRRRNRRGIL